MDMEKIIKFAGELKGQKLSHNALNRHSGYDISSLADYAEEVLLAMKHVQKDEEKENE